jgi:hypothetical protein
LRANETPAVSGEYRVTPDARRRPSTTAMPAVRPSTTAMPAVRPSGTAMPAVRPSSTSMPAVRPQIRRTSSTTMNAVRPESRGAMPAVAPPAAASPSAHRRYDTVQMQAVAPLTSGRELDDLDFDFDIDAEGALELDCVPSAHGAREEAPSLALVKTSGARMAPWPMAGPALRRSSASHAAVDPHSALVAFAGFGDPPDSIFGSPSYALRVILRRRSLRGDLERARRRKSPDVGLYEASLRAADDSAVRNGLVLMSVVTVLVMMLVLAATQVITGALHIPW